MKSYVIFDLDGCLADDRRRQPLIDLEAPDPWEAYHADCDRDPLINGHLIKLVEALYPFLEPIIFTARPEKVRAKTERWLREVAKLNVQKILMRPTGCHKRSPELKKDFLQALFKSGIKPRDISCAFDDREDVLAIYELHGIWPVKAGYPLEVNLHAQKI
jgi:hypothetical protein